MSGFIVRFMPSIKTSKKFLISIGLSIIAIILFTSLISSVPFRTTKYVLVGEDFDSNQEGFFFYKIYSIDPNVHNIGGKEYYKYTLYNLIPTWRFGLFLGLAMILFFITGTTILGDSLIKRRYLIYINWFLYSVPIIIGAAFFIHRFKYEPGTINEYAFIQLGLAYTLPFAIYPFIQNFFLHCALLYHKSTFLEWSGLGKTSPKRIPYYSRRINETFTLLFGIFYFSMITPIALILLGIDIYDIHNYSKFWNYSLTIVILASLLWFIFGEIIGRRIAKKFSIQKNLIKDLQRNEKDLVTLADKYLISVENANLIAKYAISNEQIFGSISEDGYWFNPDLHKQPMIIEDEKEYIEKEILASPRKPFIALLLCLFFGVFGIHRFYVKRFASGLLYFFTFGLFYFGVIWDLILINKGQFEDINGYPLIIWDFKAKRKMEKEKSKDINKIDQADLRKEAILDIVQKKEKITLTELKNKLQFSDKKALQLWIMGLPKDIQFKVNKEQVQIPKVFRDDSKETDKALKKLLHSL